MINTPSGTDRPFGNEPLGVKQPVGIVQVGSSSVQRVVQDLLPRYQIEWRQDEALWWTEPMFCKRVDNEVTPCRLRPGEIVEFPIIAPAPRLDTLKIQIGTYGEQKVGSLATKLFNNTEELLASTENNLKLVSDNAFVIALNLKEIEFQPGAKYAVRVLWSGTVGNDVAIHAARLSLALGRYQLPRRLRRQSSDRIFVSPRPQRSQHCKYILVLPDLDLRLCGSTVRTIQSVLFLDVKFSIITFDDSLQYLSELRAAEIVVFADVFRLSSSDNLFYDELCFDLHRHGVCTLFFYTQLASVDSLRASLRTEARRKELGWRLEHARRCHFFMGAEGFESLVSSETGLQPAYGDTATGGSLGSELLTKLAASPLSGASPRVAVVSVVKPDSEIIEQFLERVFNQSYVGDIVLVLVTETSPKEPDEQALACAYSFSKTQGNRSLVIMCNDTNIDNQHELLLTNIAAVYADVYLVVNCDCLLNRHFVSGHVFEHWWKDVDLVVSRAPIEAGLRDPKELIEKLDADPTLIDPESGSPDPILEGGFVNCASQVLSIKRQCLLRNGLEAIDLLLFSGSVHGFSGVEFGYRLYVKGAVIRFTKEAFCVRSRRGITQNEGATALCASVTRLAALFARHPELSLVASRWALDVYDRLLEWRDRLGISTSVTEPLDATLALRHDHLRDWLPAYRGRHRRLRILTYRWHVPHQYELYKLPHEFTLATGTGSGITNQWSFDQRPLRPNAHLVPMERIDPRDYDLLILHFDEKVLATNLGRGLSDWGESFQWALDLKDLPKIAICHGTVPFREQPPTDLGGKGPIHLDEEARKLLVDKFAETKARVICNSNQAALEWGFADSRVIWHGFDPQEFPPGTLARDVLTPSTDHSRPLYQGDWEQHEVISRLHPGIGVENNANHHGASIENRHQNPYAVRNFRAYVDHIRQFKIYLNTTLRSPMPRSRGEAMMTGVIPVSLSNHDVHEFIENGVDGFYAQDPKDLADFINELILDTERVEAMSRAARRKAIDVFNHDRYLAEWTTLLREVCGDV